ncbi:hypothetical protein GN244_ATG17837 [Phytophthora infestans]|uniref:Uncharacterized protein n=1 Tax=Phytophthora infestans TaxID=4787 RepID=A0A833SRP3_PHYIN|nr:hypothetical protein GN244_ATG17837 [Phytophthora infestans]
MPTMLSSDLDEEKKRADPIIPVAAIPSAIPVTAISAVRADPAVPPPTSDPYLLPRSPCQLPVQSVTVETDSRAIDNLRGYSNSEHGSANHGSVVVFTETVSSTIDNLRGDDSAQMATNMRENSFQLPVQSVSVETDGTTIDNLHAYSNSKCGSAWSVASKVTIEHLHEDGNSQNTVIATKSPFQRRLHHTGPIWLADYDPDGYGYISSGCEIPLYHMPSTVESLLANLQTLVDREDLRDMLQFCYRRFFIDMFFMKRFFSKGSRKFKPSDLWSLSQA